MASFTGVSISSNTASRPQQSLARRLLFPNHTGDLPPLLNSPDVPPELQAELYDFIALALRAYVNPWWTKITRYDKEFLPQIMRVLTTVVRALESRALALDLPALVFRDVPIILTQHCRDYRNAASKLSSSYATGGAASLPHLFHQLQPHIALSPDGKIDLEYYRQIVDHILKACLPPEDYAPEPERLVLREVFVKVLVSDVIPNLTQPWFIQRTILDLLAPEEGQHLFKSPERSSQPPANSFSFHTFIIVVLSALQSFSSTCLALIHAYKQAISTIKLVNQSSNHIPHSVNPLPHLSITHPETEHPSPATQSFPKTPSGPPSTPPTPSTISTISYPSRSTLLQSREAPLVRVQPDTPITPTTGLPFVQPQYESYASQPLTLLSEVFFTSERLAATFLVNLLGMLSASMTRFLDKLLPHLLYATLSPAFILNLVRLSKRTLFPNGYPGPPPIEPTVEEQLAVRERLVNWRGTSGLAHLAPLLLGADSKHTLDMALDPLTSQPCNVHLIVVLFDRILVGLFPELTGMSSGSLEIHDPSLGGNNDQNMSATGTAGHGAHKSDFLNS